MLLWEFIENFIIIILFELLSEFDELWTTCSSNIIMIRSVVVEQNTQFYSRKIVLIQMWCTMIFI